jgi:hypothetical protein
MKETTKKGAEFYAKWEKVRLNKWRYVLLYGVVYYGLPVGVGVFLVSNGFRFEDFDVLKLIVTLLVFGIVGIGSGLWEFKRIDSMYMGLNDDDEINKGIRTLLSGQRWEYENLILSIDKDGIIVVRNALFWLDKATPSAEELDGCLSQLMDDVSRLRLHAGFSDLARTRNVTVQVFDNSAERPLVEKTLA